MSSRPGEYRYSYSYVIRKPPSPPPVPTGGMKKAKDKRKKKGSKASPAVASPKNLDAPPTSATIDPVSVLATKKSQKRSKRNKKVPSSQPQK